MMLFKQACGEPLITFQVPFHFMVTIPFFSKFYSILPSDRVGDAKIYGDSIAS